MKLYRINFFLGIALILFSIIMYWEISHFRGDWNYTYMPKVFLFFLFMSGSLLTIRSSIPKLQDKSPFIKDFPPLKMLLIILSTGIYFYLAGKCGFYLITFLFFTVTALFTSHRWNLKSIFKIVVIASGFSCILYICFYLILKSSIPVSSWVDNYSGMITHYFYHQGNSP